MSIEKADLLELVNDVKAYLNTRYDLVVLKSVDKSAKIVSHISLYLITSVIAVISLLFASVALALYLSEYYASVYKGFFAVAAIYSFILIAVLLFKTTIKRKISNLMIRGIFENMRDE